MFTTIRPIAAGMLTATLLLAACGGGSDSSSSATDPSASVSIAPAEAAADSTFNDADVAFAQGMIPHHSQAIEMASLALDPAAGASAEVQALATAIQGAQDPEIELMTGWLQAWGQPVAMPGMEGMDNMAGMPGMEGMMSDEQMASLGDLTGPEFDAEWTSMMIWHHEGAIAQAETAKATASDPDVLVLAEQIITAQQAEVAQMQALTPS